MTPVRRSTGVMNDAPPPTTNIPLKDREPDTALFCHSLLLRDTIITDDVSF
jgi:hypothetical protein